jgi:hypothetical protein
MATETTTSNLRSALSGGNGRSRAPAPREDAGEPPLALIAVGLIAAGVGLWAWSVLGPDLRRYMKMSSM